jgi:hypothetical protein
LRNQETDDLSGIYIQNLIFAFVLYFGFNNDLRIIFFYVFTFPISVLIQILYRKIDIVEKVNFLINEK